MMKLFHSGMTGIGKIGSTTEYFTKLREILTTGVGEQKPSSINDNLLTFNGGYSIDELAIYEISDGLNAIRAKAVQIDINTILFDADMSSINKQNATFKAAPVDGWIVEDNGNITNDIITISDVNNNGFKVRHQDGGEVVKKTTIGYRGDAYFFISEDSLIFRPPGSEATWPGQMAYVIKGRNGYYTASDGAGRLTTVQIINSEVNNTSVTRLNNSEFLGAGAQINERVGFIQPWVNNEFLPYLMQSTGSIEVKYRNKMYYQDDRHVFVANLYHGPSNADSYFFGVDLS